MKNLKKISRADLKEIIGNGGGGMACRGEECMGGIDETRFIRCCTEFSNPPQCGSSCGTTCGRGYYAQYC
ncbi:hypothetical protein SAMN05421594_3355 [Chryseobacterium oleae]|uniref:Bacteriocin-type signal sequence-containing protein n=1 Tax=Chryseobacterium oleae TaxID=491207 RepID=A0A1I5A650_CHROL|nr:hypothetical protein [Chryseobacterium oleae]SFN57917.1 hypothetical protein SAMN05421594_3355 [Chryseobacterium oleae]